MTSTALDPALTALSRDRVLKRADCDRLVSTQAILSAAREQSARQQTHFDAVRIEAQRAGFAEGVEIGKQAWAQELASRHFSRQAQLHGMQDVLASVVMSSLRHLVGELPADTRFESLARQVLSAATRVRQLRLVVAAADAPSARAVLQRWQQQHPEVQSIDVVVESSLAAGDCIVETEDGAIDGRLGQRLASIEAALSRHLAAVSAGGKP